MPFGTRKLSKKERVIERYLKRRVEEEGGKCFKVTAVSLRGWPDRYILFPNIDCFVETKRPKGGKVSRRQESMAELLMSYGKLVFFIKTEAEVEELIRRLKDASKRF